MKPIRARLNNHHICVLCQTRADAIGVGKPGAIAWICKDCGIDRVKDAMEIAPKKFDEIEKRALKLVRDKLPDEGLSVPSDDLMEFLEWVIQEFGIAIREEIDSGRAPF